MKSSRSVLLLIVCAVVGTALGFGGVSGVKTVLPSSSSRMRMMSGFETSPFLNYALAKKIRDQHQTPVFVYDEKVLRTQAAAALNFPHPYGITVRFAMKVRKHIPVYTYRPTCTFPLSLRNLGEGGESGLACTRFFCLVCVLVCLYVVVRACPALSIQHSLHN